MQSHGHYLRAFCKQFKKFEKVNVSETAIFFSLLWNQLVPNYSISLIDSRYHTMVKYRFD